MTAEFWEYDTRLGRRWNLDPVDQINISNYATFANNPISNIDPLGNTVKTTQEGAENTLAGTNGILDGKANPISFNAESGELKYDDKIDLSEYSDLQKNILGRYKSLIDDPTVTNLHMVDRDDEFSYNGGMTTLSKEDANGITIPHYGYGDNKQVVVTSTDVYVARQPVQTVTTTVGAGTFNGVTTKGVSTTSSKPEKTEFSGIVSMHETAGHAYEELKNVSYNNPRQMNINNRAVEKLTQGIYKAFKINGNAWYKRRTAEEHPRYKE